MNYCKLIYCKMDLGVGSFVFSQGLVSAIPLLKDPSHLTSPMGPKIVTVLRKCLPLIFLGIVRILLVKGTEYPVMCIVQSVILVILTVVLGTRDRIRNALEFFYYPRSFTSIASFIPPFHYTSSCFNDRIRRSTR
jgi:hypothetical protein